MRRPLRRGLALCILAVLCIYSFFPIEICTLVSVPGFTPTVLPIVSCGGDRLVDRLRLSTIAALTYSGKLSGGSDWRSISDFVDSTEICTPASRACGTEGSTSFPYTLIEGKPPTDFPRFHPALRSTSSNCLSNCIHSSSGQTAENRYSMSLNPFSAVVNSGTRVSDLGVFNLANSRLAFAASDVALATCAWACAADSFALAILRRNSSALAFAAAADCLAFPSFLLPLLLAQAHLPNPCLLSQYRAQTMRSPSSIEPFPRL